MRFHDSTKLGKNLKLAGLLGALSIPLATLHAQVSSVVHTFDLPSLNGQQPQSALIRDSAGNLYGTTKHGGNADQGVVYKLDPSGNQSVLYSFTGNGDGGLPASGVTLDAAGNLYGTTTEGGAYPGYHGVVYKLDPTGKETTLFSFQVNGGTGETPLGPVTLDQSGNVYGTTSSCGYGCHGVVFEVDRSGHETILHSFDGSGDGSGPAAGIIFDPAGNIYGTTIYGGASGNGIVFKLDSSGNETVLHSFTGGSDGGQPVAGVTLDASGNLYGTTSIGGAANLGVVYKLDPSGNETVLHNFAGNADGGNVQDGVISDSAGNLYGTTRYGGALGQGSVYKLDPSGHIAVVYSFQGLGDGTQPNAAVLMDPNGDLYGTTISGGSYLEGTIYRIAPGGVEQVLYSFKGGALDGQEPRAPVSFDQHGNLYGTTYYGGYYGDGVVFKIQPGGPYTLLHVFSGPDGSLPTAGVTPDSSGNLYGTTSLGGADGNGVVYKLDPFAHQTVLHSFAGGADGSGPSGVVLDAFGNLYGTTSSGGATNNGVVFKLDTSGNKSVLYSFSGGSDGASPSSGVTFDSNGNLYGETNGGGAANAGVVYKVDPSGNETVLYSFTGGADGAYPGGGITLGFAGNLYGVTIGGGSADSGVVFKLDSSGHETVLYSFPSNDGSSDSPVGALALDCAGNVYGVTFFGLVYKVDPFGNETVIANSPGGAIYPAAGVVFDFAGNLLGTSVYGGSGYGNPYFTQSGVIYGITDVGAIPDNRCR